MFTFALAIERPPENSFSISTAALTLFSFAGLIFLAFYFTLEYAWPLTPLNFEGHFFADLVVAFHALGIAFCLFALLIKIPSVASFAMQSGRDGIKKALKPQPRTGIAESVLFKLLLPIFLLISLSLTVQPFSQIKHSFKWVPAQEIKFVLNDTKPIYGFLKITPDFRYETSAGVLYSANDLMARKTETLTLKTEHLVASDELSPFYDKAQGAVRQTLCSSHKCVSIYKTSAELEELISSSNKSQ